MRFAHAAPLVTILSRLQNFVARLRGASYSPMPALKVASTVLESFGATVTF
jgi:hypothetical protein